MCKAILNTINFKPIRKNLFVAFFATSFFLFSSNAYAGQSEANEAIARAEAKIEMATRQAGLAGNQGDQSYNMSRDRVETAKSALSKGNYDSAEMLADEAALLAELTGEKAKLAALKTSNEAISKSNAQITAN